MGKLSNKVLKHASKLIPKGIGLYICEDCIQQKFAGKDTSDAIQQAKDKGALTESNEAPCQLCNRPTKYKLNLREAAGLL